MKKTACIILTLVMMLSVAAFVMGNTQRPKKTVYYEAVTVEEGDSIWKIAEKYKTNEKETAKYVKEIMKFNHMYSANISSGDTVIIPVWKE